MDIIVLIVLYFGWKFVSSLSGSPSASATGSNSTEDPENDPVSPAYVGNDYAPHHHENDALERH